MFRTFMRIGVAVAMTLSATSYANAQTRQNNADDWSVYTQDGECWVVSTPTKWVATRGGKKVEAKRSDILMFVTYNPKRGIKGEVSFLAGYSLKTDHPIVLQIGSSSFTLYPEGEYAWSESASVDAKIRDSMKRGATAVITASSPRPTLTRDTFSLKGFTAALEDAEKRCSG